MESSFRDLSEEHPFFNYTSGRYLYNERIRLGERHLIFNFPELCKLTAKVVGKSADDIVAFDKLAEGSSYRVFQARTSNGIEVIARLPYPCTIPKGNGILSEVATMVFLRMHGLPIPKIYDWNSTSANPVGSAYMIMEKVQGTELQETWHSMSVERRLQMAEKVVELEKKLFDIPFPACGAIYFKDSLPVGTPVVEIPDCKDESGLRRFCVGPSTEYLWWYSKRAELGADIGPWRDTAQILQAVGEREIRWLTRYGRPRFPESPGYKELYQGNQSDPAVQIRALKDYLKISLHIVPEEQEMNRPTLRHPDLSPNNIFISQDGQITGIIDWQHSLVLPLFLQAYIPHYFQNFGDENSENFRVPLLPPNFESLSEAEKEAEEDLYRRRQLHFLYIGATGHNNPRHYKALFFDPEGRRASLYQRARSPWEGDNISLKAQLIRTVQNWSSLRPKNTTYCPISYSEDEVEECLALDIKQKTLDKNMGLMRDYMGIAADGWVSNDRYQAAKERSDEIKAYLIAEAESEEERKTIDKDYPFQAHEEID